MAHVLTAACLCCPDSDIVAVALTLYQPHKINPQQYYIKLSHKLKNTHTNTMSCSVRHRETVIQIRGHASKVLCQIWPDFPSILTTAVISNPEAL